MIQSTKGRLVFDLETAANLKALEFAPEPKPNGTLRDPEKVAADIAAKKAELIDRAALDPDYGQIRAIGMTVILSDGSYDEPIALVRNDQGYSEKDMIRIFWIELKQKLGSCIGYNILGFDLPYLLRRSMALGIRVSFPPFLAKYRSEPVTDLMGILYNWGTAKPLKDVAKMYGIHIPKEGVTGADVANLSDDEVAEYVKSDVVVTAELFKLMNGVYFNL